MKKKWKMIGIIIMVMIIGLMAVGCDNPSGGGKDDDKDEVVMYTVTFDSNGGSAVDAIQVESGDTITLPAKPSNGMYVLFDGWFTDNGSFANAFTAETTVSADIMLYAKWRDYVIGDTGPAGGLIFYDKGSVSDGWRMLEAAPASTEVTSNLGTAKQVCNDLNIDGINDWLLPNLTQLNMMYTNLHSAGLGGFSGDIYWSSSEDGGTNPLVQNFSDGNSSSSNDLSNTTHYVRAIRQF